MTQINELLPPEIAEEILKGQAFNRKKEAYAKLNNMASEKNKIERNEAYRKIVLSYISEKIHQYVLPFEYRFDGNPDKPQPSDVFIVEIPGLPRFSFKIEFNQVIYLLPDVKNSRDSNFVLRKNATLKDLALVLAELVEIQREHNAFQGSQTEKLSEAYELYGINAIHRDANSATYEPFEEDGPNADPEIDEKPGIENVVTDNSESHDTSSTGHLLIHIGSRVTSIDGFIKMVREITDERLAHHNLI